LLIFPTLGWGQQDSMVLVTKNFKFKDGLYLNFEEFKINTPSVSWDSVFARLHSNPQNLITLVDTIHFKNTDQEELSGIWGFTLGGIPYINLNQANGAGLKKFIGLKVRGAICYFTTERKIAETRLIKAYNPVTGIPFREGEVTTQSTDIDKYMLSFDTGEIVAFNRENFISWIDSDSRLVKTIRSLDENEIGEKLFKCLLIYDDRNPRYVPVYDRGRKVSEID